MRNGSFFTFPSWPIVSSEGNVKKLPFLIIMCRQTGFVWHKILYDWTAKSITMALLLLQYRFGKIDNIVSDKGTNLIPKRINPSVIVDNEERRLMSLVHTQTPVGRQHTNMVESRIKLVKQFCFNIIGQIKGAKFKALNLTQSEFILASAIHETNNMPLDLTSVRSRVAGSNPRVIEQL